jgi:hypothetical protein
MSLIKNVLGKQIGKILQRVECTFSRNASKLEASTWQMEQDEG